MKVDLTKYLNRILAEEDKPLFQDAVKAAECGALRAAYIMIWLSCAESLKRRFREAQQRDGEAKKVVGDIERREKNHQSVDKYILDEGKGYGFLSDSEHTVLEHIYNMRCIYGHPYEQKTSKEELLHAASSVVNYVLSRPVKLKEGFASKLIDDMMDDPDYIDDLRETVKEFTKEITARIDERTYKWFLDTYWKKLEVIAYDSSVEKQFRRGIWFSQTLLSDGTIKKYRKDEWHGIVRKCYKTCIAIFCDWRLFSELEKNAQDYLVSALISHCEVQPRYLKVLEHLDEMSCLTKRQKAKYRKCIEESSEKIVKASGLRLTTCIDKVVNTLKVYNYYIQNPVVDIVEQNGFEGIIDLKPEEQVELGRNILQAADGGASKAYQLIEKIYEEKLKWPFDFIKGMLLECFVNEKCQFRFKTRLLDDVLKIMKLNTKTYQLSIVKELISDIRSSTFKHEDYDEREFKNVKKIMKKYDWLERVRVTLDRKHGIKKRKVD